VAVAGAAVLGAGRGCGAGRGGDGGRGAAADHLPAHPFGTTDVEQPHAGVVAQLKAIVVS
jgi:hypothetical protein